MDVRDGVDLLSDLRLSGTLVKRACLTRCTRELT